MVKLKQERHHSILAARLCRCGLRLGRIKQVCDLPGDCRPNQIYAEAHDGIGNIGNSDSFCWTRRADNHGCDNEHKECNSNRNEEGTPQDK